MGESDGFWGSAAGSGRGAGGKAAERLLTALFLLVAACFLFVDGRTTPIVLWDESRNVVNALEMRASGLGLVTTYGFAPDLWNTKPPLLIWLMDGSMALFGPSEWALRLPSALAAMGTLLILILFVRKVSGSPGAAVGAATLLLLSPGFFGEGGARTGDYDSLLLFFCTAYLQLLFLALAKRRPSAPLLAAIGALIACAAMTKTVAGLIPGSGVALYLFAARRWPRVKADIRRYAAVPALGLAPLLAFYAAREAAASGYVVAVLHNDLLGRFGRPLTEASSPWVYVREIGSGWFLGGPLLLLLPLAWRHVPRRSRPLLLYAACVAGALLLVYSLASTRLVHYALPAFPWLAIAAALGVRALLAGYVLPPLRRGSVTRALPALAAACGGLLLVPPLEGHALHWRFTGFAAREFYPQASYGDLFASLAAHGASRVTVVDPGFVLEGRPHYVPLLRANLLIWRERGLAVRHEVGLPGATSTIVASCDPDTAAALRRLGAAVAETHGCAAVIPTRSSPAASTYNRRRPG